MRNLRIGLRLGVVFAALIAVVAVVGWLGVARLSTQKEALDKVAGPRWHETEQAVEGIESIGRETALVAAIFLSPDAVVAGDRFAAADAALKEGNAKAEA